MAEIRELGAVVHVSPEAIGVPGQRRFRIRALSVGGDYASIWMEKEQLSAIGDALETVLKDEAYEHEVRPLDDREEAAVWPLNPTVEIRAAQLSMGLNRASERIVFMVSDTPEPEDETLGVSFEFGYRRAFELRREIAEVVAAGRPKCPLCTAPMDPAGHVCVRSNGHNPH